MNEILTILAISDSLYLERIKALLCSVRKNYSQARFYLHLVNVDLEQANSLKEIYPQIQFKIESQTFASEAEKRAYCANIRVKIIKELLASTDISLLLYLDADSIVRQDLSELVNLISNHDLVILDRTYQSDLRLKFFTGVIGINNTIASRKFIKKWWELIQPNLYQWYSDQLYFSQTYEYLKSEINLANLPPQFADWEFWSNSPIWTAKGLRKEDNQIYLLEENYYLSQLNGIGEQEALRELYKTKIAFLEKQNHKLQKENSLMEKEIAWMKSSKFWKLRCQFMSIKNSLNQN